MTNSSSAQFTTEQIEQALRLPTDGGPRDGATVREYLGDLLHKVWEERDGFNGKRPYGESGWSHDLYLPLLTAGLIPGSLDEDGYIRNVDKDAGDALIAECIDAMIASVA